MAHTASNQPSHQIEKPVTGDHAAAGLLMIDIARIHPYERNPRHGCNPEYDRIRDSIRAHGLDQPLVVTQRPGVADYIVQAGGNTRLRVLKELLDETGDERFARVECVCRPWTRESDVLLAHLRENDLRGGLTFIDKARAVLDARRLIAQDQGVDELSLRKLETELAQAGYRVANSVICLMVYTVEALCGWIPNALEAGMGRHQVTRIRALERAARTLWSRHSPEDEGTFDAVFSTLCQRYDGPDWDTDRLRSALEAEIASEADVNVHTVRVALDAELKGRDVVVPEFVPIKEPPTPSKAGTADAGDAFVDDREDNTETESAVSGEATSGIELEPIDAPPDEAGSERVDENTEPRADTGASFPTDLKSLRGRAWTLAARLAQRNGMGDLVAPTSGAGLGFVLRDVPDPALADQLDADALARICLLWWQLAACAEMTCAPLTSILPLLPDDSVLRQALAAEDAELLFTSIWTLDPGHTGYRLWRSLHDRDWQDLLNLMETYRRIRRLAAETGTAIWD